MPLNSTKGIIRKFFGSSKSRAGDEAGNLGDSFDCCSDDASQHGEGLDIGCPGTLVGADSQQQSTAAGVSGVQTAQPTKHPAASSGSHRTPSCSSGKSAIFFARVPLTATQDELLELFSRFGEIENFNLFRPFAEAKTSKGCGIVRYVTPAGAASAKAALHNKHKWTEDSTAMVVEWVNEDKMRNTCTKAGSSEIVFEPKSRSSKHKPSSSGTNQHSSSSNIADQGAVLVSHSASFGAALTGTSPAVRVSYTGDSRASLSGSNLLLLPQHSGLSQRVSQQQGPLGVGAQPHNMQQQQPLDLSAQVAGSGLRHVSADGMVMNPAVAAAALEQQRQRLSSSYAGTSNLELLRSQGSYTAGMGAANSAQMLPSVAAGMGNLGAVSLDAALSGNAMSPPNDMAIQQQLQLLKLQQQQQLQQLQMGMQQVHLGAAGAQEGSASGLVGLNTAGLDTAGSQVALAGGAAAAGTSAVPGAPGSAWARILAQELHNLAGVDPVTEELQRQIASAGCNLQQQLSGFHAQQQLSGHNAQQQLSGAINAATETLSEQLMAAKLLSGTLDPQAEQQFDEQWAAAYGSGYFDMPSSSVSNNDPNAAGLWRGGAAIVDSASGNLFGASFTSDMGVSSSFTAPWQMDVVPQGSYICTGDITVQQRRMLLQQQQQRQLAQQLAGGPNALRAFSDPSMIRMRDAAVLHGLTAQSSFGASQQQQLLQQQYLQQQQAAVFSDSSSSSMACPRLLSVSSGGAPPAAAAAAPAAITTSGHLPMAGVQGNLLSAAADGGGMSAQELQQKLRLQNSIPLTQNSTFAQGDPAELAPAALPSNASSATIAKGPVVVSQLAPHIQSISVMTGAAVQIAPADGGELALRVSGTAEQIKVARGVVEALLQGK